MTSDGRITFSRYCVSTTTRVKKPISIFYNFQALFAQRHSAIFCSTYSHSTLISHFLIPHRLPLYLNIFAYFYQRILNVTSLSSQRCFKVHYSFQLMTSFRKTFPFFSFHLISFHWNVATAKYRHTAHLLIKAHTALSSRTPSLHFFYSLRRSCHLPAVDKTSITFSSTRPYLKHITALIPSVFILCNYYRISFNSFRVPSE